VQRGAEHVGAFAVVVVGELGEELGPSQGIQGYRFSCARKDSSKRNQVAAKDSKCSCHIRETKNKTTLSCGSVVRFLDNEEESETLWGACDEVT